MIGLLRGNFCSLILVGALCGVTASALPIVPTFDVTLTSWQLDLTTYQENFSFSGPGISLTGSGYYNHAFSLPNGHDAYYPGPFGAQNFPVNILFSALGNSLAQGTVNGVTYNATNPLGLYNANSGVLIPPFPLPSGPNPLITVPTTTPGGGALFACTPNCTTQGASVPFEFSFLPAANLTQLQFAGPDIALFPPGEPSYTLESLNLTVSPTPEPASYASLAIGLVLLWLGAKILPKRA